MISLSVTRESGRTRRPLTKRVRLHRLMRLTSMVDIYRIWRPIIHPLRGHVKGLGDDLQAV
jgi:hypothetical protein